MAEYNGQLNGLTGSEYREKSSPPDFRRKRTRQWRPRLAARNPPPKLAFVERISSRPPSSDGVFSERIVARDEGSAGKPQPQPPPALAEPNVSLIGEIDTAAVTRFLDQLRAAEQDGGDFVLELTTAGGDAELARRIVLEIDDARRRTGGRFLFLGKTIVYSAGTTIMAAFPRRDRWLSRDAMVMIHCRKLETTVEISGPIRGSLPQVEALRAQIVTGMKLEEENFGRLIEGSRVALDELLEKALGNWYLTAEEALRCGLVAGILP
jgi:ATP-dependent protease ClpP protease subunit